MSDCDYIYAPANWDQRRFLALGGFVVVFLNYNKLAQVRESVQSALDQDFPLCEMYFMDDASSDGSAEIMAETVRAYRGRHKVSLVVKKTNGGITGQWNTVARLASGNWFGMFCGDDVAAANRVTVASEIVRAHPDLLGFCTSGIMVEAKTGRETGRIGCYEDFGNEIVPSDGRLSLDAVNDERHPIIGATAFWHRSVLTGDLPRVPLDDVLLRWIVQSRVFGTPRPGFLWDGTHATIRYAMGCGVTSTGADVESGAGYVARARHSLERKRYYGRIHAQTWRGILSYFQTHAAPRRLVAFARRSLLCDEIAAVGTVRRLGLFPRVVGLFFTRGVPAEYAVAASLAWLRKTTREFFGLGPLAVVNGASRWMRDRRWGKRSGAR